MKRIVRALLPVVAWSFLASAVACSGKKEGNTCCSFTNAETDCLCTTASKCAPGGAEVVACTSFAGACCLQTNAAGYYCACDAGSTTCSAGFTKVDECRPDLDDSGGGGGDDDGGACTDKGFCGPTGDYCECLQVCLHLGPGRYTCGDPCSDVSGCTGKRDPVSGKAYTECIEDTLTNYCR